MRICIITDGLRCGGRERQIFVTVKGLIKNKYIPSQNITIISLGIKNDYYSKDLEYLGIKVYYLRRKFLSDVFPVFTMRKIINVHKVNIIHTLDTLSSFFASLLKITTNVKFVDGSIRIAFPQINKFSKHWLLSKFSFRISDFVISNSLAGLDSFEVDSFKSCCIYNGFDINRIYKLKNKDLIREKFDINTEKVIGMVANITDKKDYDTFIITAQKMLGKRNDVKFLIIGDGKNLKKCKGMVSPENRNKIKFLGRQKDVESIENVFDIGVLFTNQDVHGEGISNSIMEYMALRKPVIATDGGGTSELVIDGETGFLIEPKNPEQLADKIEYLLSHPDLAKQMGEIGKERIKKHFSLDKMVNETFQLYKNVLKR